MEPGSIPTVIQPEDPFAGKTLAATLAREKKLPLAEALGVAREIAKALAAAHEQGVIRRDVKPENVFVGKEGRIKLGDFGLARDSAKGGLSVTGQVMGTPYYMPPEQCRGAAVDPRADLYALGATLYHLANGRPPYVGDSAIDIIHQQVASPVPPPAPSLVSSVLEPRAGDPPIVSRLRQAEQEARFGEVIKLLDALPPMTWRGPMGERMKKIREDAMQKLLAAIEPGLRYALEAAKRHDDKAAEDKLKQLDAIGVKEVDEKVEKTRKEIEGMKAGPW